MKTKVLSLAGGLLLLATVNPVNAEIAAPPGTSATELDASGNVRNYVIAGPAGNFIPEEGIRSARWDNCTSTIPTLISPPDGSELTTIAPLFEWNPHTDSWAIMMMMEVALDAEFSDVIDSLTTNYPVYRFSDNFDPATTYYWRTWMVCEEGDGPYSEVWSFITGSGGVLPSAPDPVGPPDGATVPLGSTPVRVNWSAVSGAEGYQAMRHDRGGGTYLYSSTELYVDMSYLDENTTHEWWVRARNDYGYGSDSASRRFRQNLVLESGDYDGDGRDDIAIFRDRTGLWAVRGVTRIYFGKRYDIPVPGDYNGDGTTEPAIFRSDSGLWAARGVTRVYYGAAADLPIPADYDGDGSCEVGIFRGESGLWALRGLTRFNFGVYGDTPFPPGYDGSPAPAETVIFRASAGLWTVRGITQVHYGAGGDWAAPGDYFGPDSAPAIFRGSSGLWAVMDRTRLYFGAGGDAPVPGDYNGADGDDIAIFRDRRGLWAVRGVTRVYFGRWYDLPVTR
ncbi:MAG: hypothetical protein V1789_08965 [PVC group bacterium]